MQRLENWRSRLFEYIENNKETEFKFGKFDCCLFGADIVERLTGIDLAAEFRGHYRSFSGGYKLLKKAGYDSHQDFIAKHFDQVESVAFMQAGDIGIVEDENGLAVTVCLGQFSIGLGENGLVRFENNKVSRVYRV